MLSENYCCIRPSTQSTDERRYRMSTQTGCQLHRIYFRNRDGISCDLFFRKECTTAGPVKIGIVDRDNITIHRGSYLREGVCRMRKEYNDRKNY